MPPTPLVAFTPSAEKEYLAYFQTASEHFQQAANHVGGPVDLFFDISGFTIRLRFAGEAFIPFVTPALAHLSTEPTDAPDLTICLWDSASTGSKAPLIPSHWPEVPLNQGTDSMTGRRRGHNGNRTGRFRGILYNNPNILSMIDTQAKTAVYWTDDVSRMPHHEMSAPLRTIFSWWFEQHTCQLVHAAAVGTAEGGVLLVGKGGSGKSTAALACLDSGLHYAGDDYCSVTTAPRPHVHSLYNSAKLKGPNDLERFAELRHCVHNGNRLVGEKAVMFLHQYFPEKMSKGFPLKAVLVPRIVAQTGTTLKTTARRAALAALAPSTLIQLPGSGPKAVATMVRVVEQVPCYAIHIGRDIRDIPRIIENLLSAH